MQFPYNFDLYIIICILSFVNYHLYDIICILLLLLPYSALNNNFTLYNYYVGLNYAV